MKKILRAFFFYTVAIYIAHLIIPGFQLIGNWQSLIISGLVLALMFLLVQPVLNFLLLPINMFTMGLFSFVSQVLTFYLFLFLRPEYFAIKKWMFEGWQLNSLGIEIGTFTVSPFFTIILTALLISFLVSAMTSLL
jgi:uncharacterized membrane protein YvlD (DUF360 family)